VSDPDSKSLRILVRCSRTGAYLDKSGVRWTETPAHAHAFWSVPDAIQHCHAKGLIEVNIVVQRPGQVPLRLPLPTKGAN
jgi:hypothetical protein